MAKIKGIQAKSYSQLPTSDGVAFTVNLYMDNKKVGMAENSGTGGMTDIHFENHDYREEFSKRVTEYYQQNPSSDDSQEDFIEELLTLTENEKIFKKKVKAPFTILLKTHRYQRTVPIQEQDYEHWDPNYYLVVNDKEVQKTVDEEKPGYYVAYKSLEDFIIN